MPPEVTIVDLPDTLVAALEHHGPPEREHETARRFIAWRIANRLPPDRHRTYGVHHTDPRTTPREAHRMDICVSVDAPVADNADGVVTKVIAGGRHAVVRHHGSRDVVAAAAWLVDEWLPGSGEARRDGPLVFHYVNVGPQVAPADMVTDVYLPLR